MYAKTDAIAIAQMVKANNTMTQEANAFNLNQANLHANLGEEEKN